MEYTHEYNIADVIYKNPTETYDIFIYKPEFVSYNVKEVIFSLQDESGDISDLIDNFDYFIYCESSLLYKGKIEQNSNIFPVQDIPLSYIKYHTIMFVIKNIDTEFKTKIIDKKIVFRWTESNVYPTLDPANPVLHQCINIKWNTGLEKDSEDNYLRITNNMVGTTLANYFIDEDYIEANSQLYTYNDTCKYLLFNVNHLDENYQYKPNSSNNFDYYCSGKLIELLLYKNKGIQFNSDLYVPIISETCKIQGEKITQIYPNTNANLFKYQIRIPLIFGGIDAISNIKLICDNSKYLVEKIYLIHTKCKVINNNYTYFEKTVDIEYKPETYGYKAIGMDNFLVSVTIFSKSCDVQIEFETKTQLLDEELDDFAIVFDRICFDTVQRRNIGKNMDVIEEYYITDITDYYKNN